MTSQIKLARFWSRAAAYFTDISIMCAAEYLYIILKGWPQPQNTWIFALMMAFGPLLYMTIPTALMGQTPGKWALGMMVVQKDGKRAAIWRVLLRETFGRFFSVLLLFCGYLFPLFRKDRRALHDLMSQTKVIQIQPRGWPAFALPPVLTFSLVIGLAVILPKTPSNLGSSLASGGMPDQIFGDAYMQAQHGLQELQGAVNAYEKKLGSREPSSIQDPEISLQPLSHELLSLAARQKSQDPAFGKYTFALLDDVLETNPDWLVQCAPRCHRFEPGTDQSRFTFVAYADLDQDAQLDVWMINELSDLFHFSKDLE